MGLTKARLVNISKVPEVGVDVLYNPTQYEIDNSVNYAELPALGLPMPILQFTRGNSSSLTIDLFLDRGDQRALLPGADNDRGDVERDLDTLRSFIRIDGDLHAPPVVRFEWGRRTEGGQPAPFEGVVSTLKETFMLFTPSGRVSRAKVNVVLKSYQPTSVQQRTVRPSSPDRTRVRVVREGETLQQLAFEAYGDARLWRTIADENRISRVRFLKPGLTLRIPSIT